MPRLAICSRDLHWHWINRTLLCDTMEVSMLSRAWLTIAQHVFQPVLTGGPELISRKIVSGEPGTKAIAVSRFSEKLSPANWVQGVTAISRKISRSWAPKKWGPTCDRDISNSAIYTTAIYRAYTVSDTTNTMNVGKASNFQIPCPYGQTMEYLLWTILETAVYRECTVWFLFHYYIKLFAMFPGRHQPQRSTLLAQTFPSFHGFQPPICCDTCR